MENKEQQLREEIKRLESRKNKTGGYIMMQIDVDNLLQLKAELKGYQTAKQEFIEKIDKRIEYLQNLVKDYIKIKSEQIKKDKINYITIRINELGELKNSLEGK